MPSWGNGVRRRVTECLPGRYRSPYLRPCLRPRPDDSEVGEIVGQLDRGSHRTSPGPQGAAGRRPRPLSPLDAGLAARPLSGVAPPPADGCAISTPLRGGTRQIRLSTLCGCAHWLRSARWAGAGRPTGLPGAPAPAARGRRELRPPLMHRRWGASNRWGDLCLAAPPSPSATWLGPGAPRGPAQRLLLGPPRCGGSRSREEQLHLSRTAGRHCGACHSQTWTSSNVFGNSIRPISTLAHSGVAG